MIQFLKCYTTEDGQVFKTVEEAQQHELELIVGDSDRAKQILDNSDRIIDILTTAPNSRPRGRKINGGTRKKRKGTAVDAPSELEQIQMAKEERAARS